MNRFRPGQWRAFDRALVGLLVIAFIVFGVVAACQHYQHRPMVRTPSSRGHVDLNCSDYTTRNFPTPPGDPNHLDGDHDGIACESH